MYQELDADSLAYVRRKIHGLVNPGLAVATLREDGLKDVTAIIGDLSVLPVEVDGVSGAVPRPKA
ncbi:MAG: hypothetical protein WA269_13300 [Candidatus Udaeobacter sp.]